MSLCLCMPAYVCVHMCVLTLKNDGKGIAIHPREENG